MSAPQPAIVAKALLVGIDEKHVDTSFKLGVVLKNHWEIYSPEHINDDTTHVLFSGKFLSTEMGQSNMNRIKVLAQQKGISEFGSCNTPEELRDYLTGVLGVKPVSKIIADAVRDISSVSLDFNSEGEEGTGELLIETSRIRPQKDQPRTYFSKKKMDELKASIRVFGQIMPILVKKISDDPDHDYELIEGERRLRACKALGWSKMRACVRKVKNVEVQFITSFGVNFAREGHTHLETARALDRMLKFEMFRGLSQEQTLKQILAPSGKTTQWARLYLRLLTLSPKTQACFEPDEETGESALPLTLGVFLSTIDDRQIQEQVAKEALEKDLSVRQARSLARGLAIKAGVTAGAPNRSPKQDYRVLCTFMDNTTERLEDLLNMPHRTINELFAHRNMEDRVKRFEDARRLVKLATKFRDEIDPRKVKTPRN